jgi:hypothetical protein
MSSGFLSVAERERWQRFPETIPQDDLAIYFLLSDDDTREVNRQREPFNRLGYALQLCTLRYLDLREGNCDIRQYALKPCHTRL